jgi:hypothetical protein
MEEILNMMLIEHKLLHIKEHLLASGVMSMDMLRLIEDESDIKELVVNYGDRLKFKSLLKIAKLSNPVTVMPSDDNIIIHPDITIDNNQPTSIEIKIEDPEIQIEDNVDIEVEIPVAKKIKTKDIIVTMF